MFRVQYGTPHPVEVQAETPAYPNRDSDGQTIFENTHFLERTKAWKCCVDEHLAGLKLDSAKVETLRQQLAAAEKRLADAALLYTQVLANRDGEVKA
jgi:hypothetical protein